MSNTTRIGETPTFSVAVSNATARDLASIVVDLATGYGATIVDTVGVWEDRVEPGARIEFQGPVAVWRTILKGIASALPSERMAHHEVRVSDVTWLDLDDYRNGGN